MSGADGGGPGRREVAVRCFAAEYEDAELEYSESDEERAPNYVVTPTGARINRLFVVGVLTEVESVSDDVLRGRVVDPTGAFVIYAGQYQPDAKTFLERADPPQFVAVTGKARTFQPDDSDRVFTSIRPESINAVDAGTRDRWTVQTAEHTVERVATAAAALDREDRGDALESALLESDVDSALAAGIPRAIDHYGTAPAYLAAIRDLAIQAAEVVAGERDEVEPLDVDPDEGGPVEADLAGDVVVEATGTSAPSEGSATAVTASGDANTAVGEEPVSATAEADEQEAAVGDAPEQAVEGASPADATGGEAESAGEDELGDFDAYDDAGAEADEPAAEGAASDEPEATGESDELYEVDEDERQAIEEEYGTDFSTGSEVGEPGEADIETPGPVEEQEVDEAPVDEPEETVDEAAAEEPDEPETDEAEEGTPADVEEETAEPEPEDVDLEDAVVGAMQALDEGDGAERSAVVETVAEETGADPAAVEDAIDDALMSGRCYEPEDGRLKAI